MGESHADVGVHPQPGEGTNVSHHLVDADARSATVNMIGSRELDTAAGILRAGHTDRHLRGRFDNNFCLEMAAIEDVVGDAGPIIIAHPPLRTGPHLISSVVRPARLHVILRLRQHFPLEVLVHEKVVVARKLELDGAPADVRRND